MSRDLQDQCFHESVHDKWCLRKGVWQTEVGFERGFVRHCLNSVYATRPSVFQVKFGR